MICRDDAAVTEKLCRLGDDFRERYARGEYARAMFVYYEALTVAVFMKADEGLIKYLFGHGDDGTGWKGLFDMESVHRAQLECWRRHENAPYVYLGRDDMVRMLGNM